MQRTRCLMLLLVMVLGLIAPAIVRAGTNTWTGTGPYATGLGNRVITALAVSTDNTTVYCGTASGTVFSYNVAAPTAITNAASPVHATDATLNGTVNANGVDTTVTFEYGADTSYGGSIAASPSPVTGTTATSVSAYLSSLTPAATYHYRVKAESSSGTTYGGDQSFTLDRATTTTVVSPSSNPSNYGQSVTFTATVTGVIVTPTGNVNFQDNGTSISGCSAVAVTGATTTVAATCTAPALTAGTHSITAVYGGDTSFYGSTSPVVTQTVNKATSTTALTSSLNPSTYGQSVTFTATVTSSAGTPTGTVAFMDGATTLGTGTLNGSGQATFSTSALAAGTHSITAVYGGDTNFNTSTSSAVSQTVNQASSTTGLSSSSNPSSPGQSVTFTATVPNGATGTVDFRDGGTLMGSVALAGTTATFATSGLGTGSHTITATYSGDTNFAGSTSSALTQTVRLAPAITSGSSTTFIMGTSGTFTVTASGYPAPTFSITSGTLPSGVTLNTTTGEISGAPAVGTHGAHVVTITASNGTLPNATQSFTLTVQYDPGNPALTLSTLPNNAITPVVVLNISGIATSPNGIQSVTVNGTRVTLSSDGSFSVPFQLALGSNTITVVATDNAGHTTTDARTITLNPANPTLTLTSPVDGAITSQNSVTVTGTTSATSVAITVNGGSAYTVTPSGSSFTRSVGLSAGLNTIVVTATDNSGASRSIKRTVIYQPAGPDLTITSPASDLVTSDKTITLTGTASSTSNPVTVSISFNGNIYTPTVTGGAFTQQITFPAQSSYPIVVTATDASSNTATAQRNVIYSLITSGDINGDGKVNATDVVLAQRAANNSIKLTADQIKRGDVAPMVNHVSQPDGKINTQDVILIQRKAAGLSW